MIKENLKIFSQNIRKNKTLTDIILENNKKTTDIIFIQEPPRYLIQHIPSYTNPLGDPLYSSPNHPDWTLFIRQDPNQDNYARVATYVNKHLTKMRFTLWLDIINHRDISVVAFHGDRNTNFMINIYFDSNQTAFHFLCQNAINLDNTVIITGDFNIRDSDWDPLAHHHSIHTDDLMTIADSLGLELSHPSNPGPTRFADNPRDSNSVLDLVFLPPDNSGSGKHILHPEIREPSDHVPLTIEVGIRNINIDMNIWSIRRDSEEEKDYITSITNGVYNLNTSSITTKEELEDYVQQLAIIFENAWRSHSKLKWVTKHSKEWWNQDCTDCLNRYRVSGDIQYWKEFKANVRTAKRKFFDEKIYKIVLSNKRPWDLMNWVRRKSLPAIEAISYEDCPCNTLPNLWRALHNSYNSAEDRPINTCFLNEIPQANLINWPTFSKQEFRDAIAKCSSSSSPGPDHISWRHLKHLVSNNTCLEKLLNIANACFNLGYWPSHFKAANSVIIPKPNKESYSTPKSFHPIVLLNTTGKLIEKAISNRLQFYMVTNKFLDPNQLGGIRQQSTTNTGIYLTHLIRARWLKQCHMSVIAFDIAQFFPSLNHHFLSICLEKAGLNTNVRNFFSSYHSGRSTSYLWNSFVSPSFDTNVGVDQGSALSPILSAIYLAPIIKTFKKRIKNLK